MQNEQSFLQKAVVAAVPEDATATAIFLICLTLARRRLSRNVLPVPRGASRNVIPSDPVCTFCKMI